MPLLLGAVDRGSPSSRSVFLGAALLFALAAAGGAVVGRCTATDASVPSRATVVRPSPSVITAVRDLARLEGAVFYIERVVDVREKQSRFWNLLEAEDALLLVAGGDVIGGVDLAELRPGDVVTDDERRRVIIYLPRATVLSRRLDNERTYVHTRRTGTWAVRQEHLETRARQEAERTLEDAALEGGILRQAEENVGRTVESLLRSLGYQEVEVRFRDSDPDGPPRARRTPG